MRRIMLAALVACVPVGLGAVPPPPDQVTADCVDPTYASDLLVCETPELRELDERLAALVAARAADPTLGDGVQSDADWFLHSRRCAFEADQRTCLTVAYCRRIALLTPGGKALPQPCAVGFTVDGPASKWP